MKEKYTRLEGCSTRDWLEYLTALKKKYDTESVEIEEAINFYEKEIKDEKNHSKH